MFGMEESTFAFEAFPAPARAAADGAGVSVREITPLFNADCSLDLTERANLFKIAKL